MILEFFSQLSFWEILFFFISLIATIAVLTDLFFVVGDHTDKFFTTETAEAGSTQFLQALAHLVNAPVIQGGQATVQNNGDEFVPALLADLQQAKNSINIMVYIWKQGHLSDQIFEVLREKQKSGVQVRILLDGLVLKNVPHKQFQALKNLGAKIEKFRTVTYGRLTRLHRRNHRRAIVIDGEIAYTGGMVIEDKWLGDGVNKHSWRDSMTRVTNPLAGHIQSCFAQLWASTCGEVFVGSKFYPGDNESNKNTGLRAISLASSPQRDTEPLPKFLCLSLTCAKNTAYITTPYFIPVKPMRDVIISLAEQGVEVKILLPGKNTDQKLVRWAGQYYYEKMLKAGVKIYEYQPSMLHNKIVVVDGKWSVVGSANMDSRSLLINEENVLGISDAAFAKNLEQSFERDLKSAQAIYLNDWQKRSFLWPTLETICMLFAKQF